MKNVIHGNNLEILKTFETSSIDSIVTDPPYGIRFLGKDWDTFKATKVSKSQVVKNLGSGMRMTTYQENLNFQHWCSEWAAECLRVLKPGGYLLAFSAARLYHQMACGIEAAGFEIRDQMMWLYGSGFPKAQDIGKAIQKRQGVEKTKTHKKLNGYAIEQTAHGAQRVGDVTACDYEKTINETVCTSLEAQQWEGWKTALKPAHEPIVMARKPFKGSSIDNVLEHGVGALNIDASRIPYEDSKDLDTYLNNVAGPMERSTAKAGDGLSMFESKTGFKAQKGKVNRPSAGNRTSSFHNATEGGETQSGGDGSGGWTHNDAGRFPSNVLGEVEGYQKYFYCPKVSRKERHIGHETPPAMFGDKEGAYDDNGQRYAVELDKRTGNVGNNHPTVKPVALMEYLITLVTPKEGTVLDPFMGSGSTGMAACGLGYNFIGIDLDAHYCQIAETRIEAWCKDCSNNNFNNLFEKPD